MDEDQFETSKAATWFFGLFMFLMVLPLANVLIAIVTDSYKVIQDKEAAVVFYTNRLYFLAETDAISNSPCFQLASHSRRGSIDTWAENRWDDLW